MGKYMIMLRGKSSDWDKMPDQRQTELINNYMGWVEQLKNEKILVSGSELNRPHRDVKADNGKIIVDGPFAETKEVLTGYFIVKASDLDSAVEISKGCPALTHGDWLQVYEMPDRD